MLGAGEAVEIENDGTLIPWTACEMLPTTGITITPITTKMTRSLIAVTGAEKPERLRRPTGRYVTLDPSAEGCADPGVAAGAAAGAETAGPAETEVEDVAAAGDVGEAPVPRLAGAPPPRPTSRSGTVIGVL